MNAMLTCQVGNVINPPPLGKFLSVLADPEKTIDLVVGPTESPVAIVVHINAATSPRAKLNHSGNWEFDGTSEQGWVTVNVDFDKKVAQIAFHDKR